MLNFQDYKNKNSISTLLQKQYIIEEMATNQDFADSSDFEEILRLLDGANNAIMAQLSHALRSVTRLLRQNLLDQSFDSYTDLMRYISRLNLRDQDLTDLAQVVENGGKTAAVRDMKMLSRAMKSDYFIFMISVHSQNEMQNEIDNADQISRKCLQSYTAASYARNLEMKKLQQQQSGSDNAIGDSASGMFGKNIRNTST